MTLKTYSRARAAVAAAKKALDGIAPFILDIKTYETEAGGRFTAAVHLVTAADRTIKDEVKSKGFGIWLEDEAQEHSDEVDAGEDETAVDNLEEEAEQEAAVEAKKPARGSGYIRGSSDCDTPVAVAREVFGGMPEGTRRKDMIAAAIEAGVTYGTARTQYQKWFEQQKNKNA